MQWEKYKKEGNNPYGIVQSKTFGTPVISGNFTNTNPNRIRWAGDPISALDFNATTVMPSFKQRWNNSAHSYSGLFIKDAVENHDTMNNPSTISGNGEDSEVITE